MGLYLILLCRCFFAKKKCEDPPLTILYPGPCNISTPAPSNHTQTTTWAPDSPTMTTTLSTADIIHDVFCANKDQFACTTDLDPVCGTDLTFYQNEYVDWIKQTGHVQIFAKSNTRMGSFTKSDFNTQFTKLLLLCITKWFI